MKKMMMMVATIGLLAVGANAGQVQWLYSGARTHDSLAGSADGSTTLNNGTAVAGAIAYLFVGTLDAGSINTAIQDGSFGTAASVANAVTATTGSTGFQYYGTYGQDDVVTAYVVVFDGTYNASGEGNYWISSAVTKTFGATGNQTYSFSMTTTSNWTHYNNVPEPTSMALLALGVAAVGLRRRFRK